MRSIFLLLIITVFLSGCAGINFKSAERWVENNTLYSTKAPSLEIKVSPSIPYRESPSNSRTVTSDSGFRTTGGTSEWFYFATPIEGKLVRVHIENLDSTGRVRFVIGDFSGFGTVLFSENKTIDGASYKTGIVASDYREQSYLAKIYGRVVMDTNRYLIMYMEEVDRGWLIKSPSFLSQQESEYIREFNNRADESFTILPYSGAQHPDKRPLSSQSNSLVKNQKQSNISLKTNEKLSRLEELRKTKVISAEEYHAKRNEIIDELISSPSQKVVVPKPAPVDKKLNLYSKTVPHDNKPSEVQPVVLVEPRNHVAVFPSSFHWQADPLHLGGGLPDAVKGALKDLEGSRPFRFTNLLKEKSLREISWDKYRPNMHVIVDQAQQRGIDFVVLYYFRYRVGQGLVNGWGTDFFSPDFKVFLIDVHNQTIFKKEDSSIEALDQLFLELKGMTRQLFEEAEFPD